MSPEAALEALGAILDLACPSWDQVFEEVRIRGEAKLPEHVEQCLRERAALTERYGFPGDQNVADHVIAMVQRLENTAAAWAEVVLRSERRGVRVGQGVSRDVAGTQQTEAEELLGLREGA